MILRPLKIIRTDTLFPNTQVLLSLALVLRGVRKGDLVGKQEIDGLLVVVVDVVQLQQVLVNLIRNAVEAMSDSKMRELTIGARQAGDKVIIEISDTGTGIPAADRPDRKSVV